jgi:uncharacterized protein (TIGR03437 family)
MPIRRRPLLFSGAVVLLMLSAAVVTLWVPRPEQQPSQRKASLPLAVSAPITFEENRGQADPEVEFLARSPRHTVLLSAEGLTTSRPGNGDESPVTTRMTLVRGNSSAKAEGVGPVSQRSHYFIGNDPAQWRTNVRHYDRVRYSDVYPDIDLVYYSRDGELEYDFVVAPAADPSQIELVFEGASDVHLDASGDLRIGSEKGETRHRKPFVYQEIAGLRAEVSSRYDLRDANRVGFALGAYDPELPLVVDPKLQVSSFTGGGAQDFTQTLAYGPGNALWLSGASQSTNFPIPSGSSRPMLPGLRATFLARYDEVVDADGRWTRRLGETIFIGGSSDATPKKLQVDEQGILYLLGDTDSSDFPTTNDAFQRFYGGGDRDIYVSIIDPGQSNGTLSLNDKGDDGPVLLSSTFVGGFGDDFGEDADLGDCPAELPGPCFFWTGNTTSTNLNPTANAPQHPFGGKEDGLVGITAPDPTPADAALGFLMRFGGSGSEVDQRITATTEGGFCLGMTTDSTTLPVPPETLEGSVQPEPAGGTDGFITCLRPLVEKSLNAAGLDEDDFSQDHDAATFVGGGNDEQFAAIDAFIERVSPSEKDILLDSSIETVFNSTSRELAGSISLDDIIPPGSPTPSEDDPGSYIVAWNDELSEAQNATVLNPLGPNELVNTAGFNPSPNPVFIRAEILRLYLSTSGNIGFRQAEIGFQGAVEKPILGLSPEGRTGETASNYSSVLLGGAGDEVVTDGALGPASAAAVGFTNSTSASPVGLTPEARAKGATPGFPVTAGAPQRQFGGGSFDGFLIEFYQPQLLRAAVLGGASFLERDVSGGQILTLFAFSVGAPAGIGLTINDDGMAADQLGLTRVLFDGEPAPMVFANRSQASVIAPLRIQEQERTLMQVEFDGVVSNAVELIVGPAAPGLFSLDGTGSGQGAILNPDFSVNGPDNPAPGDGFVIVYGTGGGMTNPACPDGGFGPFAEPLPRLQLPVRVLVDGAEVNQNYAGSAPGLVCGVNQFNVIPTNNPSGPAVPIQVCVNEVCSNIVTAAFE